MRLPILLLLVSSACRTANPYLLDEGPEDRSWSADFSTLEGRIAIAQSAVQRHPQLVMENLAFNRSLLEVIEPVPELHLHRFL